MKFFYCFFFISGIFFFSDCQKESLAPHSYNDSNPADDEERTAALQTKIASEYNHLFTRSGNGWTGGDATYSVPLPDGRVVWMFGDTFLDTVYADRSRPPSSFIRNSFVVENIVGADTIMTTLYSGTRDNPRSFLDTGNPNQWYWPLDGTTQNNTLYVYFALFKTTGSGAFDFKYLRTDLVAYSLPDITLQSITTVSTDPVVHYGDAVMEDGGYLYIYGDELYTITHYAHAARVPLSNLYAAWEYWNGSAWTNTPPPVKQGRLKKGTKPVDVSTQFSVFYWKGKYRLVTQDNLFGPNIYSYTSSSPTGPWSNKVKVYTTPETGGNIWTYNAFVHPEFTMSDGWLLMSYNVNSMNFQDVFDNADDYRPKFIYYHY